MSIKYRKDSEARLSVSELDGNFQYIEDELGNLSSDISQLEVMVESLDLAGLTASVLGLEGDVAGLTSDVASVTASIAALTTLDILKEFKPGSVGEKVSFRKVSGTNPATNKDVIIPGELEITRGASGGGGIYNIALESSYSSENNSPQNTFWNTQYVDDSNTSWAPLWDIENRNYTDWRDAVETNYYTAPPQYVGMSAIMKWDNGEAEPRYWLIMFTQWGVGAYGEQGSFAYDRYEILEGVYVEQLASNNPNTTQVIDIVSDGVHITRRYGFVNNEQYKDSIYNIVNEPFAVGGGVSPRNTKWNSSFTDTRPNYSGYTDLSNLDSRVYVDFIGALDGDFGNILSTELIMRDMTTDLYYKVQFTEWAQCDNGPGTPEYDIIQQGLGYPDAGVGSDPWLRITA